MDYSPSIVQEAINSKLLVESVQFNEKLLTCIACNCTINGTAPAAQHLQGSKHMKAYKIYAAVLNENGSLCDSSTVAVDDLLPTDQGFPSNIKLLMEQGVLHHCIRNGSDHFHCQVCNCDMSGTIPTNGHIAGLKHIHKCASFLNSSNDALNMSGISSTAVTSFDNSALNPYDVTSKLNSLPESSLPQHADTLDSNSGTASPNCSLTGDESISAQLQTGILREYVKDGATHYECTVCRLAMTGTQPATMHLRSKGHKKKNSRNMLPAPSSDMTSCMSSDSLSSVVSLDSEDVKLGTSNGASVDQHEAVRDGMASGVLVQNEREGILYYQCTVCSDAFYMVGVMTVHAHLIGKRHIKSIRSKSLTTSSVPMPLSSSSPKRCSSVTSQQLTSTPIGKTTEDVPALDSECVSDVGAAMQAGTIRHYLKDGVDRFECTVCNVAMVGLVPVIAHLKGKIHAKIVARKANGLNNDSEILPGTNNSSRPTSPEVGSDSFDIIQEALSSETIIKYTQLDKDLYKCTFCFVAINNERSLVQHLTCQAHAAAVTAVESSAAAKAARKVVPVDLTTCNLEDLKPKEPGQIDLQALVEAGKVQLVLVEGIRQYHCVVCDTFHNSKQGLVGHVIGSKHHKNDRRSMDTSVKPPTVKVRAYEVMPSSTAQSAVTSSSGDTLSNANDMGDTIIAGENDSVPDMF